MCCDKLVKLGTLVKQGRRFVCLDCADVTICEGCGKKVANDKVEGIELCLRCYESFIESAKAGFSG
jgi:hypothetical protein